MDSILLSYQSVDNRFGLLQFITGHEEETHISTNRLRVGFGEISSIHRVCRMKHFLRCTQCKVYRPSKHERYLVTKRQDRSMIYRYPFDKCGQ